MRPRAWSWPSMWKRKTCLAGKVVGEHQIMMVVYSCLKFTVLNKCDICFGPRVQLMRWQVLFVWFGLPNLMGWHSEIRLKGSLSVKHRCSILGSWRLWMLACHPETLCPCDIVEVMKYDWPGWNNCDEWLEFQREWAGKKYRFECFVCSLCGWILNDGFDDGWWMMDDIDNW